MSGIWMCDQDPGRQAGRAVTGHGHGETLMSKPLNELGIHREAMDLGEAVRHAVVSWAHFVKDTIGKQLVRSVDSMAANLSGGCGRFHFAENRRCCRFPGGSLPESPPWIEKGVPRNLLAQEAARDIYRRLDRLRKRRNRSIETIGSGAATPHDS